MKTIARFRDYYSCFFLLLTFYVVIGSGCGRSPRETARFARAGTTYTTAMDTLLVRTSELSIDANSEFLVNQDSLTGNLSTEEAREEAKQELLKQYEQLGDEDRRKLLIINRLRAHTKLLAKYFERLYELSTSDAPAQTATAVEGTVRSINQLGNAIRGDDIVTAAAKTAIANVAKLIVTAKIRQALTKELELRNETIRKELVTQEELLKILASNIEQDLITQGKIRENRTIIEPLLATNPIGDIDGWKTKRRNTINAVATIDDLRNASGAIVNLRVAYESLMSGKLNIARINDALDDLELIISTAEAIKKAAEEKP